MTFSIAIARGGDTVDALVAVRDKRRDVSLLHHNELAVAWSATSPWVDTVDDGDVLAVVDGRLHAPPTPRAGAASTIHERYRKSGRLFAGDLLGDFVAVVLDRERNELLVARDPVGVRPWYHATLGRRHAGATDLATVVALHWVDSSINEGVAIEYLAAVEESRGDTLYRGVRTLRPGRTWCGGPNPSTATELQHHRWRLEPDLDIGWDEAAERCRAVLDEVVLARLTGMGPPASELSGGLDSSTVVGTLALLGCDDLVVSRLVFDTPWADEREFSDAVIAHWRLRAVSAPPWIPARAELDELSDTLRRPAPDANFTMFAEMERALKREGRLDGFTGLGGDDAFLAYGVGSRIVSALQARQWPVLRKALDECRRDPRRAWRDVLRPTAGYLVAPWRRRWHATWVTANAARRAGLPEREARRPQSVTGVAAIDERLSTFTSGYNASILETRASIGDWVGRRQSHPFLDPRFVEATYGLDPWWPTRGGHSRALEVEAFADRLPAVVANRRTKAEFSEVFWPQVLDRATLAEVRRGPLRQLGWLDADAFDDLVTNARRGMTNAAIPLSRCVSLHHWVRTR